MHKIQAEITNLNPDDLFLLANHKHAMFDYPIHFHSDYELNLVINTAGKRVVGDSVENFSGDDLVLLGSNLPHAWKAPTGPEVMVINIKFQDTFQDSILLSKRLFSAIRDMLERSSRGICFGEETTKKAMNRLMKLTTTQGFSSALEFLYLLYELATSTEQRVLASPNYSSTSIIRESHSQRISKICKYIEENYHKNITLKEIGEMVNMSESAVSHFFKKRTSRNFITFLNDIRIGNASRLLGETTKSISDIAYMCGYTNLSNFNQIFKKYKNQTPSDYRSSVQNSYTKF